MANWGHCQQELYWSANHNYENWKQHGNALIRYPRDEEEAYAIIRSIQSHNEPVQENYDKCRESNKTKFWSIAQSVWHTEGPKDDV